MKPLCRTEVLCSIVMVWCFTDFKKDNSIQTVKRKLLARMKRLLCPAIEESAFLLLAKNTGSSFLSPGIYFSLTQSGRYEIIKNLSTGLIQIEFYRL